jgi:hypothetical protein
MRNEALSNLGGIICGIVCLLGLFWELVIVKAMWGFGAAIVAFVLFPGTLALVPWYMLFAYGNCQLIAFVYGGLFLGGLLILCNSHGKKEASSLGVDSDEA